MTIPISTPSANQHHHHNQQEEEDYLTPENSSSSPTIIIMNNINHHHHHNNSSITPNNNPTPTIPLSTTTTRSSSSSSSNNKQPERGHQTTSPRYGWCSLTPDLIQFLVNRKAFLFIFCLTCVLQGTFHTYFVAVITTLEKLFSIPSQVTGMLMMGSEIGQVSSALLLPFFVGQGHRPRWMAIGSSLFSFATLLCASPHILIPLSLKLKSSQGTQYCGTIVSMTNNNNNITTAVVGATNETLLFSCKNNSEEGMMDEVTNPHFILFPIIFLSLFTIGLGQTAVYTLGIPFLDDNVASRDSPIYFSITIGVKILGPVLGFITGALCTRLYIYPHHTPDYDPTDPRWLGAWWLGMILISGTLFLTSLFMYGFPATLKKGRVDDDDDEEEEEYNNKKEISNNSSNSLPQQQVEEKLVVSVAEQQQQQQQPKLRYFPRTLKRLLSNRILILRTFSSVFHLLPISGLYTFLPKYLESQFRLAAHQANMVTGIAGILVMGIGIFSSGVFIRRREPSARGIALWVAGAAGIYSVGMVMLMFVGCGVGGDDGRSSSSLSDFRIPEGRDFSVPYCEVGSKCEKCSESVYSPVCGSDNYVYYSPCHAGCSEKDIIKKSSVLVAMSDDDDDDDEELLLEQSNKVTYSNCSCVVGSEGTATSGMCPVSCDLFPLYLTIFMVIVLVHSTSEVGSMLLTLRCVEPRDKAMALGLIQCAIGIFGNVPCPVIYGTVVDSACIVWGVTTKGGTANNNNNNNCGGGGDENLTDDDDDNIAAMGTTAKRGHCWVYDSASFRIYFHGTTAVLMFIAFLIDIVVVFHANKIKMGIEEEEEEDSPAGQSLPPHDQQQGTWNKESCGMEESVTMELSSPSQIPDDDSGAAMGTTRNPGGGGGGNREEASPLLLKGKVVNGGGGGGGGNHSNDQVVKGNNESLSSS